MIQTSLSKVPQDHPWEQGLSGTECGQLGLHPEAPEEAPCVDVEGKEEEGGG